MMYVHRYGITFKEGIAMLEGPIAYLMFVKKKKNNVRPHTCFLWPECFGGSYIQMQRYMVYPKYMMRVTTGIRGTWCNDLPIFWIFRPVHGSRHASWKCPGTNSVEAEDPFTATQPSPPCNERGTPMSGNIMKSIYIYAEIPAEPSRTTNQSTRDRLQS